MRTRKITFGTPLEGNVLGAQTVRNQPLEGDPDKVGPFEKAIGARLALARQWAGMTRPECARLVGVHPSAWARYESGHRGILYNAEGLGRFCQRVNVPADVILFGRLPRATVPLFVANILDGVPPSASPLPEPAEAEGDEAADAGEPA